MAAHVTFRSYSRTGREACLSLFDANCPEFFAPNERDDYATFLDTDPTGYELCIVTDQVAGAFGLIGTDTLRRRLNWIMLNPQFQGLGIGSAVMTRVTTLAIAAGLETVDIAASHKSAPFFAKFGAVTTGIIQDGWGPGMHRVDMALSIQRPNNSFKPKPLRGSA
jgi:GNAT superfamily N-acetyltransferase